MKKRRANCLLMGVVSSCLLTLQHGRSQVIEVTGNSMNILGNETVHRSFHFGPYTTGVSVESGRHSNCGSPTTEFVRYVRSIGRPKPGDEGLSRSELKTREIIVAGYKRNLACDTFDGIDSIVLPWLLSNNDVRVTLYEDSTPPNTSNVSSATGVLNQRGERAPESSYPHADVNTPDGLTIGTLFADDPPAKYEGGKPVYDIVGDGLKFVRRFKSLTKGSLADKVDLTLNIGIDPKDRMEVHDNSTRTIISRGEMQSVEWDMYPHLERNIFEDQMAYITLQGAGLQYSDSRPQAGASAVFR
jgi:hypothetical protein